MDTTHDFKVGDVVVGTAKHNKGIRAEVIRVAATDKYGGLTMGLRLLDDWYSDLGMHLGMPGNDYDPEQPDQYRLESGIVVHGGDTNSAEFKPGDLVAYVGPMQVNGYDYSRARGVTWVVDFCSGDDLVVRQPDGGRTVLGAKYFVAKVGCFMKVNPTYRPTFEGGERMILAGVDQWPDNPPKPDYPHECPRCKAPAYIGFSKTECSAQCLA